MGKASPGITETLGILVIIAALYYLLQTFGLLNHLVPDRLADSEMGYGMLFAIGLITSVHCIAMCGGIGVSQSLPNGKEAKALLPAALYNLGRVCSYTAIGFVLGLIGNFIGGGSGIASLVFLLPLLYLSMGHMLWEWPLPQLFDDNHVAMGLVQLILTGIIMVINQKFFVSGFKSLIHRAPNMDALVALGSSAAITTKGSAAIISIMCTEWACMLSERDS